MTDREDGSPRLNAAATPQLRSALFVPGHRGDLIRKATAGAADALILDLEDSVPPAERERARANVAALVADPPGQPRLCVRINGLRAGVLDADLDAAVGTGLLAVIVPKVEGAADVARVSAALAAREAAGRVSAGAIRIWPLIENAAAVLAGAEIAASDSARRPTSVVVAARAAIWPPRSASSGRPGARRRCTCEASC